MFTMSSAFTGRHERAAPRLDIHEVLEREALDRLAQRGPADAHLAHQRVLAQDRPGRQVERHDPIAQFEVRALGDQPRGRGVRDRGGRGIDGHRVRARILRLRSADIQRHAAGSVATPSATRGPQRLVPDPRRTLADARRLRHRPSSLPCVHRRPCRNGALRAGARRPGTRGPAAERLPVSPRRGVRRSHAEPASRCGPAWHPSRSSKAAGYRRRTSVCAGRLRPTRTSGTSRSRARWRRFPSSTTLFTWT